MENQIMSTGYTLKMRKVCDKLFRKVQELPSILFYNENFESLSQSNMK